MFTIKEIILLSIIALYVILYSLFKRKKKFKSFIMYIFVIALFIILAGISFDAETSYKFDYFYKTNKEINEVINIGDAYSIVVSKEKSKDDEQAYIYTPHTYKKSWFIFSKSGALKEVKLIDFQNREIITGYSIEEKGKTFYYLNIDLYQGKQTGENPEMILVNQSVMSVNAKPNQGYAYFEFTSASDILSITVGNNNYTIIKE